MDRAGKLLEALSRAFASQLSSILAARGLMRQSYDDFVAGKKELDALFAAWKQGARRFEEMFLDLWKKRVRGGGGVGGGLSGLSSSSSTPNMSVLATGPQVLKTLQGSLEHLKLQQRLEVRLVSSFHLSLSPSIHPTHPTPPHPLLKDIATFRAEHARFLQVVGAVLAEEEDTEARREVESAYARFVALEEEGGVLDTSGEGAQAWRLAHEAYAARIDRLEGRVIR